MNKKGFTLIELIIVVAIIGILASIVLVGLGGFRARGRDARRIADLKQVQNGLELYFARCGHYPGTANCASNAAAATWSDMSSALLNSGLGVNQVPDDPITANNYGYCREAASTGRYVIGSVLEDVNNPALTQSGAGAFPCAPATTPNAATACSTDTASTTKLCATL